jgi:hypothetical protein
MYLSLNCEMFYFMSVCARLRALPCLLVLRCFVFVAVYCIIFTHVFWLPIPDEGHIVPYTTNSTNTQTLITQICICACALQSDSLFIDKGELLFNTASSDTSFVLCNLATFPLEFMLVCLCICMCACVYVCMSVLPTQHPHTHPLCM